jgi:hypothetical protein
MPSPKHIKLDRFESLYGIERVEHGDDNSGTGNSFFESEQNDNEEESAKSYGTHGTDSGKETDTSEGQEKDSSQDGTHWTGRTHSTDELEITKKDESSHRERDRTDGAYSEEKLHPIEEETTQKMQVQNQQTKTILKNHQ